MSDALKEHDIVVVTSDDVEYISSSPESFKDTFSGLPKGTKGTVVGTVSSTARGCYVEFPYIQEHHPRADSVMWMTFDQINLSNEERPDE